MRRKIGRILAIGVAAYVALVAMLYVGQRSMQYIPDTRAVVPAGTLVDGMNPVVHTTRDGLGITSWYWLPGRATQVVVMFHGNAQNLAARDFKIKPLIDAGYGAVMVGYRGYGGNPGTPSQDGLMNDARAVMDNLIKDRGLDPGQIFLYGESLGTGVAVQMAHEYSGIRGLVLEVPFDSALAVAKGRYPFIPGLEYLMHDPYRSDLLIGSLTMPKLVLLAGQDWIVPNRHGRRLYELAAEPKTLKEYPKAGHNSLYDHGAGADILAFLAEHKGMPVDDAQLVMPTETVKIMSAGETRTTFKVEVASTHQQLERGLMGRTSMADDTGMLFILPEVMVARFWMRDTLIPLDLIFLDQDGRIIKIHENAIPRDETTITSDFPARAVLEVNAGLARRHNILIGDLVISSALDLAVRGSD